MEALLAKPASSPERNSLFPGRFLEITNLPVGHIGYNINTISPSSRSVSPTLYDSLQQQGLVAMRVEKRESKWRTPAYRPGAVVAMRTGDTLTLRPDIWETVGPEGSNTEGHEDPRISLMELNGKPRVVVSNVEVDGYLDPEHPTVSTVLYAVENEQQHPWATEEIARIKGKDVQIEQLPNGKFLRIVRPNEHMIPGTGGGRIAIDVVDSVKDLSNGFEHAKFLEYPEGQGVGVEEKEGGNQAILLFNGQGRRKEGLDGIGLLLIGHRASFPKKTIYTGDIGEDFEQDNVRYVATAAYIPSLGENGVTADGKYKVQRFEEIANIEMFDVSGKDAKEDRLKQVLFTGGYNNGDILCGAMDAYPVAIKAPEWVEELVQQAA